MKTGVPNWQVSFFNLIGPWLQNREGVGANIFDVKIQCASGQAFSGVESERFLETEPQIEPKRWNILTYWPFLSNHRSEYILVGLPLGTLDTSTHKTSLSTRKM